MMDDAAPPAPLAQSSLDQISTRWPVISDPIQFTFCYAPAIQRYLETIVKNRHDAEEILQDFLLRGLRRGFARAADVRGRFRTYLKVAVRHAAVDRLRRGRLTLQGDFDLGQVPDTAASEHTWVSEWRQCVLARAWEALYKHQRQSPANFFHTALRLAVEHEADDSPALACRAAQMEGRPINAAAFRQQLSRARRLFAELLLREVAQTLEHPTPEDLEAELMEVGLLPYVRDFLPPDWRSHGTLTASE